MEMLLSLAALACLSLFLAHTLRRSASLMPLVALCLGMLWFTVWGAVGALRLGGWLWYLLCAAALGWLIYKLRGNIKKLITPGFVIFLSLSVVLIGLFWATKPMFTQWDEFVTWGTAAKVVRDTNMLYTTAPSNLLARYQPPGLAMLGYMLQFFGGFAEYKLMAAYAILYVAVFCAAASVWDAHRAGAMVAAGGLLALPILFQLGVGEVGYAYVSVMADMPMAVLFGGALCLYYTGGEKNGGLLAMVAVVLAALTNLKDMGFALALVALAVILLDLLFMQRKTLGTCKAKRLGAVGVWLSGMLAAVVAAYGGWALHLNLVLGTDRTDVGAGGESLGQLEMLAKGIKALFGIVPDEVFSDRAGKMVEAFLNRRVWLLGSGLRIVLVIVAISLFAWALGGTKTARRRVLLFSGSMALGCVVYHVFLVMTYAYVFHPVEGAYLIGYDRYILPYWFAWLLGAVVLLWQAGNAFVPQGAEKPKQKGTLGILLLPGVRAWGARAVSLVLCMALLLCVGLRANWQANFMRQSPSLLQDRLSVQAVLTQARTEGMEDDDVVYLICQGDNATRFYMFAYEMRAQLSLLYGGEEAPNGTMSAWLVKPGDTGAYNDENPVWCSAQQLMEFLREKGCTHVLLDKTDEYIVDINGLGYLFEGGLGDWGEEGGPRGGQRYYRIEWQGDQCRFVPESAGGEAA